MDDPEQDILRLLQANGRMTNVELAERIALSESPTFRRVKLLEQSGAIRGYVALLDQKQLGLQITAYVSVRMAQQPDDTHHGFHRCVEAEPHIVECHAMSGSYDFLMKVVAVDMEHFADLCMQHILKYPGVQHVESSFSLKPIKSSHQLPVAGAVATV
ncbi:MAG: Lrp/AsnC family transcriptional regulator [Pseudomonadales bacterium]